MKESLYRKIDTDSKGHPVTSDSKSFFFIWNQFWLTCVIFILPLFSSYSLELKKVLILDIKNIEKNQEYQYLELSITEAIQQAWNKKFAMEAMDRTQWLNLAKSNFFIFEDSWHTKEFALQMGLLGRQDIVFGGGFRPIQLTEDKTIIRATFAIIDIAQKQLVKEIVWDLPVNNDLFSEIEKLAEIATAAGAAVLPNKETYTQKLLEEEKNPGQNRITLALFGNLSSGLNQTSDRIEIGREFRLDEIPSFSIVIEYHRLEIPWSFLQGFLRTQITLGSKQFFNEFETKAIPVSLTSFNLTAGLSYTHFFPRKIYLMPGLGLGYQFSSLKIDYSNLAAVPLDLFGNQKNKTLLDSSAPVMDLIIRVGYVIRPNLFIETQINFQENFYQNAITSQLDFGLAGILRF